ncbi:hypothetical protein GUITHDRAFT_141500 [Guillardia theta CCMP2712]|uniref:Uncharacterized protein n=1 Tax=Guillardia theta (strain CCMP2712) TaxID=905079 RepID=L1J0J1_GUITC|nr:hypothetical protein GUITHDRAFT_141500 [Guillardia theta CCMP2712]EKX42026.1 hypothetical protein GUITHDRAFT_141500 [Guillardia theta CCMP2712]|eukprot:XP_005829006.1 hypothetical protein GUITHDRAFT_141500 [Guillardia theta CCMP2712]
MQDLCELSNLLLLLLVALIAVLSIYSSKLFSVDKRNHSLEAKLKEVLSVMRDAEQKQKKMQDYIYSLEAQLLCSYQVPRATRTPSIGSTGSDAESSESPHSGAGYQWDSKGKRRSPKKCRSPIRRATSICGSSCMSLTKEERTTLAGYKRLSPNNVDYTSAPHSFHFDDITCGEELFDIEEKSSTQHMHGCSSCTNISDLKRAPSQSSGSRFYANVVREKSGYSSGRPVESRGWNKSL